ncbi:MAG: TonB-dependent receptor [Candidatus Omnitrophica bacterium]|nr:TonB-dependent receptor [Candidatus Omnitrophota bacterium]MDD5081258.1 TonB-dependent receptor [Candidatus Omnitrophota bacterium]MDD5441615.1 TonB-dependent receptor [Candidatus Omnitrophota bacterium]
MFKKCIFVFGAVCFYCMSVFCETIILDPIVLISNRMPQSYIEYGCEVSVVDGNALENSTSANVADMLDSLPGMLVRNAGTSKTAVIDIRGMGDSADRNVLVLLNGRKLNNPDNSGADLIQVPLSIIDRVEVLRGAGSVMYGDNAIGGVVNIITKKNLAGDLFSTTVNAGSYGRSSEETSFSAANEFLSVLFSNRYFEENGYRANSEVEGKDWISNIGWHVSDRLDLDFDVSWHEDKYGMPGGLTATEIALYGRRGTVSPDDYAQTKDRTFSLGADYKVSDSPDFGSSLALDYSYNNRDTYAWFDYGIYGAAATKRNIDTHGFLGKYTVDGIFFGKAIKMVTGVDYYRIENVILGSGSGWFVNSDDLTISKDEIGIYGFSEYNVWRDLYLSGGVRYQQAKYTFDVRSTDEYEVKTPDETVFRGGLRYQYSSDGSVFASIEESFRFLSTDEWYSTSSGLNTSLQQQTGIQYQIGLKQNFFGVSDFSTALYQIDNENEIYVDPTVSPGNNANYDKTRRRGIELSNSLDIAKMVNIKEDNSIDQLLFNVNYTYQIPEFSNGEFKGNDIPMVPRHKASVSLRAKVWNKLNMEIRESIVGSFYAINDTPNEAAKEKTCYLTDIELSLEVSKFTLFLGVNNLFDRDYNIYAVRATGGSTSIDYYPAYGRTFNFGVKMDF